MFAPFGRELGPVPFDCGGQIERAERRLEEALMRISDNARRRAISSVDIELRRSRTAAAANFSSNPGYRSGISYAKFSIGWNLTQITRAYRFAAGDPWHRRSTNALR
jgi:hypothetical protein